MTFNYAKTQAAMTALIKSFGVQVQLIKPDNSSTRSWGVWGKVEKQDMVAQLNHVATETRVIYVCGDIKKVPEINDTIAIGAANWNIKLVDVYKPANTVVAYKLTATN